MQSQSVWRKLILGGFPFSYIFNCWSHPILKSNYRNFEISYKSFFFHLINKPFFYLSIEVSVLHHIMLLIFLVLKFRLLMWSLSASNYISWLMSCLYAYKPCTMIHGIKEKIVASFLVYYLLQQHHCHALMGLV